MVNPYLNSRSLGAHTLQLLENWKSTMNGGVFMGKSYMDGSLEP